MESIIAAVVKFFFSPFLEAPINDHQFGVYHCYLNMDVMLFLFQQRLEVFNLKQEVRTISLDIDRAFNTVWHPALFP